MTNRPHYLDLDLLHHEVLKLVYYKYRSCYTICSTLTIIIEYPSQRRNCKDCNYSEMLNSCRCKRLTDDVGWNYVRDVKVDEFGLRDGVSSHLGLVSESVFFVEF